MEKEVSHKEVRGEKVVSYQDVRGEGCIISGGEGRKSYHIRR